ncbi:hypothetical protein BH18ACT2_BH18ACT2_17670 [soil metagenome]
MNQDGNWEPPRTGSGPPPPPPGPGAASGFGPPVDPTATYPTATATVSGGNGRPGRRSGTAVAAVIVGVVALVGAGVFAVSRVTGSEDDGGAESPEAAGRALLAAVEDEDALGVVDVLLPGERETLRGPLTDLVAELRRIEVLSEDADLASIGGIDIQLDDESIRVDETNVDDIANLRISGRATASVDGEALPVGDLLLDNDADPAELDTEAGEPDEFELPLTAVRQDGRWYVSAFYTVAELARQDSDDVPDIPEQGIVAVGADSPEDAMDNMIEGLEALDLEGIIGSMNPQEFAALQRYAPLFIEDAQRSIDDADAALTFDDPEYAVSGSGDTRSVGIEYLRVTVDVEDDPGTITLQDGCWTIEARDETVNTCQLGDDLPELEDMLEDAAPVRRLIEAFEAAFDDYENPGFVVKEVDGKWFLSPMATGFEQVLAVLRAVDRVEIEDLIAAIEEAMESDVTFDTDELLPGEDLIDDYSNPNEEPTEPTIVPGSTPPDETLDPDVPSTDCYLEDDATAAGDCFQELVEIGEIDPLTVPFYLRAPDCGLADIGWTGDYYNLPDDEFVALVEEAAPCFQEKVASGAMEEGELPLELEAPQCLDGRNWYTATDDDAYYDALIECASQ